MLMKGTPSSQLDLAQIGSIVGVLRGLIINYVKLEFAHKFPYANDFRHDTINEGIDQLLDETTVKTELGALKSQGFIRANIHALTTAAMSLGSAISLSEKPTKYWRLEHIKYFTNKAQYLANLVNSLLASEPSKVKQITKLISIELQELSQSIERLSKTAYGKPVQVSIGEHQTAVQGMLGGGGMSALIRDIQHNISTFDFERLESQLMRLYSQPNSGSPSTKKKRPPSVHQKPVPPTTTSAPPQTKIDDTESQAQQAPAAKQVRVNPFDDKGYTTLHRAIIEGNIPAITQLLDEGANIQQATQNRRSCPLLLAIQAAKSKSNDTVIEVLDLLLSRGTDVNQELALFLSDSPQPSVTCNALHYILFNESPKGPASRRLTKKPNVAGVQLLLKHGIDTTATPPTDAGAKQGSVKDLQWYVSVMKGASCANKSAHIPIVQLLQEHGHSHRLEK